MQFYAKEMKRVKVKCPHKEGVWLHVPTNEEIDVYRLEPVAGQLCVWGPDVGQSYTGARATQGIWDSDEWQGHILVEWFDEIGPWIFIRSLN